MIGLPVCFNRVVDFGFDAFDLNIAGIFIITGEKNERQRG
jgi:hypothetical protein